MTFKGFALSALLVMLCSIAASAAPVDTNVYRIEFTTPLDTCFISDSTLPVNITVYNQVDSLMTGLSPLVTIRALGTAGGGSTLVNQQTMTDNKNGTYSYPAISVSSRPNTYFEIRVRIAMKSTRIEDRLVIYHSTMVGAASTDWRLTFVNPPRLINGDSNTVVTVRSQNTAGLPDTSGFIFLSVVDSSNQTVLTSTAMTSIGNGYYRDTLSGSLFNNGEDYIIRVSGGSLNAATQRQICVEVVKTPIPMPTLIALSPDTITSRRPTLTWHPATGATTYTIQIDSTPRFTTLIASVPVSDTSYTSLIDLPARTLYWRVSSNLAEAVFTPASSFTIIIPLPVLIPLDPSSTTDATPQLQWHPVAGATSYIIQLDTLSRFLTAFIDTVTDTSFIPASNLATKTYYWRVSSSLASTRFTTASTFTVIDGNIPVVIPFTPDPTPNRKPTLTWHVVAGASSYNVQIDTLASFANTLFSIPTSDSFYTTLVNLPLGRIFWRVKSNLSETYSKPDTFTIVADTIPLLVRYNGDTLSSRKPNLAWHPVNRATVYTLQLSHSRNFNSVQISSPTNDTFYLPLINLDTGGTYYWRVSCDLNNSVYSLVDSFIILNRSTSTEVTSPALLTPALSVYPNPFSNALRVMVAGTYAGSRVTLNIYSISGKHIKTLIPQAESGNACSAVWNITGQAGEKLGTGIYLVRATVNGKVMEQKILGIK